MTSATGVMMGNFKPAEYYLHLQHDWSWHGGGCHITLADGGTHFLSYKIDHQTYLDLSRRDGFEVIASNFLSQ